MELIDKKLIISKLKSWIKDCDDAEDYGTSQSFEDVICLIEDIPTTDGIVHAKWKQVEKGCGLTEGHKVCSVCGKVQPCWINCGQIFLWGCNYCPACGAKMDAEED